MPSCPKHNVPMKPLFSSFYCDLCDAQASPLPTPEDAGAPVNVPTGGVYRYHYQSVPVTGGITFPIITAPASPCAVVNNDLMNNPTFTNALSVNAYSELNGLIFPPYSMAPQLDLRTQLMHEPVMAHKLYDKNLPVLDCVAAFAHTVSVAIDSFAITSLCCPPKQYILSDASSWMKFVFITPSFNQAVAALEWEQDVAFAVSLRGANPTYCRTLQHPTDNVTEILPGGFLEVDRPIDVLLNNLGKITDHSTRDLTDFYRVRRLS